MKNNLFLVKYLSQTSTHLVMGTLTSLMLFPASKALASYPSAYTQTINLSVDYHQCMDRAIKAANLVSSSVGEPIAIGSYGLALFAETTVSRTTLTCVKKEQGSTLVIVSSGDSTRDIDNEAESIRNRLREVFLINL